MNYQMVAKVMGKIMGFEMVCLLVPLALASINGDWHSARAFAYTIAVTAIFCLPTLFIKSHYSQLNTKDILVIVAGAWIVISLFGSLPYYFSGLVGNYVDCLFESVSGFTTTGATILSNIEVLPISVLFWRNFTHYMAGMGVLILVVVIFNLSGLRSYSLMGFANTGLSKAKTAPKVSHMVRILFSFYFGITFVQIIVYMLCGMPFFDSLMHAFSTAATGGFSIKNASVAAYNSTAVEMATSFFMIVCGINFNLIYLMLIRRFAQVLKNEELKIFFLLIIMATALISYDLCQFFGVSISDGLRMAIFQVATIISTTGLYSEAFEYWPQFSKVVLLALMFIGGCAGSVGGGIKVVRTVLGCKLAGYTIHKMLHPRAENIIYYHDEPVESAVIKRVAVFIGIYWSVFVLSFIGLSWCNYDFETTISATVAAISNIGPGLGRVGPTFNYGFWPTPAKCLLIVDMFLGRLEFLPLLLFFVPEVWSSKQKNQSKTDNYVRVEK